MKNSIPFLTSGVLSMALAAMALLISGCMTTRPSSYIYQSPDYAYPEVLKSEGIGKSHSTSSQPIAHAGSNTEQNANQKTDQKLSAMDSDLFSDQEVAAEVAAADGEFLKEAREVSAASAEDTVTPHRIPLEVNQEVKKWIHFFTVKDRDRFQRFLERGAVYKDAIQSILRKNGVPKELYYLGMIESGYHLHARSHAKAVGPWQFIPGTGKRYGLMQSYEIDERRDIIRSTEAAALYLSGLYTAFQSWYLAMAGYNAGEGRVLGAVVRGSTRNFWELVDKKALPPETRNYVPKFLAAMMIGRNPERYGFKKVNLDERFPEVDALQVSGGVSLNQVSRKTRISVRQLSELNPHLLKKRTPRYAKNYYVWVPKGVLSAEALAQTDWKREVSFRKIASKSSVSVKKKVHVVRKGETLHKIANRYGTTVKKVKKVNRIKSSQIRVGQRLQIITENRRSDS